jgi:hypothetical protein
VITGEVANPILMTQTLRVEIYNYWITRMILIFFATFTAQTGRFEPANYEFKDGYHSAAAQFRIIKQINGPLLYKNRVNYINFT